ncbi:hypothetical protein ABTG11_10005 [Acinetobacter baumannii]|uniref:hypothetical protein n=1 Tax=Acinetobacter TaxID=469 RepID=UPI000D01A3FD|nr:MULTISPECIES: hypothetical protein [Acinetobacter]MCJ8876884.1 hypothetical protein [Acinetobacter baumannii]MCJ8980442.1 hypothetical protein [Acinetobacter baumannii]MCJ9137894.1 hypothetical protein [Acinetobacter baumannii]MCJ9280769.1 hypothetical protein [Acinetobacter baumannii]MCJ9485474.1 hypothetical protein [Acinetobacter baumannii]
MSKKKTKPLHEVSWLHMGRTNDFEELKADIQHVCKDVQGFIKEIAVNDIVQTFLKHGYVVVKKKD